MLTTYAPVYLAFIVYMHHEVPWPPSAYLQSSLIHLEPNLQCLSTSIDAVYFYVGKEYKAINN